MTLTTTEQTAMDRILAALDNHQCRYVFRGGQYSAQCPAHDDSKASMMVKNGDGKVLLCCHAGCTGEQILDALNLGWPDLFDNDKHRDQSTKPMIVAEADYPDENGVLLYQKVRYTPKDFKVRRPDGRGGWIWSLGDVRRVLYRLPDFLPTARSGGTIYVVEGEKDANRLIGLGLIATCNVEGAATESQRPKWKPAYSAALTGAHVRVIADNDPPGYAHARAIGSSLAGKAASVKLFKPAVVTPKSDVSDHLDAGLTLAELVELPLAAPDPNTGDEPPDVEPSSADLYQPIDWHELWKTTSSEPDWLVPDLLERGRLHAIWAPRKHKKSLFTLVVVASLASGKPVLGRPNPHGRALRVLYIDIENARDDIRERLQDAGYRPDDLANLIYFSFPSLPGLDSPTGGAHLMALVERHEPDLVVLDTTSRIVTGKKTTRTPSGPSTATRSRRSKPTARRSCVSTTPAKTSHSDSGAAQPRVTTSTPHG